MYIGYLLPTLVSLRKKLNALKPSLQHAGPLVDAILAGLADRFNGYSERTELIIASVTLPQFKLRWLDDVGKENARSLLYSHVTSLSNDNKHISESDADSQEDDFFSFGSEKQSKNANSEVDMFLSDPSRDLLSIKKFPLIFKLFLQFNTSLPSSASVERLFSLGSQIYLPRRNRLSDNNFERQLLLRANKWICDE